MQTNARAAWWARTRKRAVDFVAKPGSAVPLAVLRIGLCSVLLAQAVAIGAHLTDLYGRGGVVEWAAIDPAGEGIVPDAIPRVRWLVDGLAPYGVDAATCVRGVFLLYVTALACLLIGWRSRASAVVAWLTHLMLNTAGNASIYGVDQFAHIALFYCTWMPVGHAWSWDRSSGRVSGEPTAWARLSWRVLQVQMSIVYVVSGIEKGSGAQWWNGEAIWRALSMPELAQYDFGWLASAPWLAVALCWGTLFVEVFYPVFCFPRRTRLAMVLATMGLHAGIAVTMGLASFSGVMIVLNAAAFVASAEPGREWSLVRAPLEGLARLRADRGGRLAGGAATSA